MRIGFVLNGLCRPLRGLDGRGMHWVPRAYASVAILYRLLRRLKEERRILPV
jgi:hypothetical protein